MSPICIRLSLIDGLGCVKKGGIDWWKGSFKIELCFLSTLPFMFCACVGLDGVVAMVAQLVSAEENMRDSVQKNDVSFDFVPRTLLCDVLSSYKRFSVCLSRN